MGDTPRIKFTPWETNPHAPLYWRQFSLGIVVIKRNRKLWSHRRARFQPVVSLDGSTL